MAAMIRAGEDGVSGAISKTGLWDADKYVKLSHHKTHLHRPSPISPSFVAPEPVKNLSFRPYALAAAIARTATTRDDAPVDLLNGLKTIALIELDTFLQEGNAFELKPHFSFLADTQRSQFAARVGAGITDLYMNALGYAWRANAACLSSALDPHADFIYDGGSVAGHGVVLSEARGSFAANASGKKMTEQASRKYLRQVKPHLARTSPFGTVIHGYSVAFGSCPAAPGSFLSLSETRITAPGTAASGAPPAIYAGGAMEHTGMPIALAAHRSNFVLMGARPVVDWIDWIRSRDGEPPERESIEFLRLPYAGRVFLVPAFWLWDIDYPFWSEEPRTRRRDFVRDIGMPPPTFVMGSRFGWFAIEETAGRLFLNAVSAMIEGHQRALTETIRLPTFEPVGFDIRDGEETVSVAIRGGEHYPYALFRDGLALLGKPFQDRPLDTVIWSPHDGLSSLAQGNIMSTVRR